MGVDVGMGTVTGVQADDTKLTNKNTTNPRFIIPIFLRQSIPPNGTNLSRTSSVSATASCYAVNSCSALALNHSTKTGNVSGWITSSKSIV